jgi:hypothetical protein
MAREPRPPLARSPRIFFVLKNSESMEMLGINGELRNFEETYSKFKQRRKTVEEFRTYIVNNRHLLSISVIITGHHWSIRANNGS